MTQHFYFLLILQPRGNPCQSGYCLNDGDCFYQATNDNAICTCRNGFTGSRCEVSPCESLDCPENSECVTANGGAVCRCSPGFAGKTLGVVFCLQKFRAILCLLEFSNWETGSVTILGSEDEVAVG